MKMKNILALFVLSVISGAVNIFFAKIGNNERWLQLINDLYPQLTQFWVLLLVGTSLLVVGIMWSRISSNAHKDQGMYYDNIYTSIIGAVLASLYFIFIENNENFANKFAVVFFVLLTILACIGILLNILSYYLKTD